MANQKHLDIFKQGVDVWNKWREEHPEIEPDLSRADTDSALGPFLLLDLRGINLSRANMRGVTLLNKEFYSVNFSEANLSRASLGGARFDNVNMSSVDLSQANLSGASFNVVKMNDANLKDINLNGAYLSKLNLQSVNLTGADLTEANLLGADLTGANLTEADLRRAELSGTHINDLDYAKLDFTDEEGIYNQEANLSKSNLQRADLSGVNLSKVDLHQANLQGANLSETILRETNLSSADLRGANLNYASLVRTKLESAKLTGCQIYGISAWDVQLDNAKQEDLVVTLPNQPILTVDNLKVAQFIYLLLNNAEIRDAIDTIAKKAVLILGRFTPERKSILEAIRAVLRDQGYLPILFDFQKSDSQDLTGTVSTLANISRFIIADLTDPSCSPYEIGLVAPYRKPIKPLFQPSNTARHEFAMFQDLRKRYSWVLPVYRYKDHESLLASLQEKVILPAEQKVQMLEKIKRR